MKHTHSSNRPDLFPYIITVIGIVAVFYFFGFRVWFVAALFAGILIWWRSMRKIVDGDGKIVLVVSIETGEITPYIIGRERWQDTEKIGRPTGNFATASGNYVDVLKSYDPKTNVAEYPAGDDFSDIYIASIPKRYEELITNLEETKKENIELKQHGDIRAIEIARENISRFADEINNVLTPRKGNDSPKTSPNSDDSKDIMTEVEDGN